PHHTPFPEIKSSHPPTSLIPLPSIPTSPFPTITQPDITPIIQYSRRARIAQSSALLIVADEPASPVRDDSQGEACPTDFGFIADQDRATIAKSSTLPHDSAPRDREALATKQYGEDALIKGRSTNEGETAAERISNDSEEIARVLTSMDASTVLARETDVPTGSGFIPTAGPLATVISTGSEDRATIAKSSTLPHDSAPRVTSPAADEGSMQHSISELTALCTSLQRQHSELLAKFQAQEGRSINEGEAATERISNDSEDIARVLTSMDATTVLAGGIDVPTSSGSIPTAGPPATVISTGSEVGPTASLIIDAQGARELEKQQEKEDMRMNEQIARDVEVVRIHAEEELQGMIDSLDKSNETIAKYLQEYQEFASELPLEKRIELISNLVKYQANYYKVKDFKGLSFEEIESKFTEVRKQVEDFIPMGSKEEAEKLKRKGLNLEQEHVKKQKSSEQAHEMEKYTEEITKEKMKEMMQLVL
nr:hypothetical protein [Tanacetum cinerariifolium]